MNLQRRERLTRALDQGDVGRAARGRFKAEDAAAGEQIEAGEAAKILSQPVEQGFAHPVRRRPQAGRIGYLYQAAAPFAASDADAAQDGSVGGHNYRNQVFSLHMTGKGGFHLLRRDGLHLRREFIEVGQGQAVEAYC